MVAAETTAPGGRSHASGPTGTHAGHLVMHTAEEATRLLKAKRSWLERQAAARKIPFSMLGGSYRFSDRHLAEIVRINEVAPVPPAPGTPQPARTAPEDADQRGADGQLRTGRLSDDRPRPQTAAQPGRHR